MTKRTSSLRRRKPSCRSLLLLLIALMTFAASCGSNADEQRLQQDKLDRAREEGRKEATRDEKLRELAQKQKQLESQNRKLKKKQNDGGSSGNGGSNVANATAAPSGGGGSSCGGGLSVGSNTTCAFAANVKRAYYVTGGDSIIEVYSPVTQRTYTMSCTAGSSHVCRGGNNATVYF